MSRILIITPNWIGDTVAAQPLFMRLKAQYPNCTLDAVAPAWVAPVLHAMPEIDQVFATTLQHGQFSWAARKALAQQLAQRGYQQAYVLPNSWKSGLIPWLAKIPLRVGYWGEGRIGLLNRRFRLNQRHTPLQVERYALLAQQPGEALQRPLPNPCLARDAKRSQATVATLGLNTAAPPVIFCPGAEYGPAKRWPETHFAQLAQHFVAQGFPVWLLGSNKDAPVGNTISELGGTGITNLCGKTNLSQAVDLISLARIVVTNDSGLMHVAAALDVPVMALFGSSSPGYTPPLSAKARVVSLQLSCSPCYQRTCPLGHLDCLNQLDPQTVATQAERLLAELS